MNDNTHIIGITGGSGSGKTFLCEKIIRQYDKNKILIITVDSYYKDLSHISLKEREKNNFDHPNAIDFDLLYKDLLKIIESKSASIPIYDYKTHTRSKEVNIIDVKYPLILIEGILSLYDKRIRNIMDDTVFIDISNNTRKKRRIKRDTSSRDRTVSSIINQYDNMVTPMFEKYVRPMKKKSNIIIKKFGQSDVGYIKLIKQIQKIINE